MTDLVRSRALTLSTLCVSAIVVLSTELQRLDACKRALCMQVWRDVAVKGFWLNVVRVCPSELMIPLGGKLSADHLKEHCLENDVETILMRVQWLDSLPPGKREKRLKETMGEFCCPQQLCMVQPMRQHLQCPMQKLQSFAIKQTYWRDPSCNMFRPGADLMAEKVLVPPPPSKPLIAHHCHACTVQKVLWNGCYTSVGSFSMCTYWAVLLSRSGCSEFCPDEACFPREVRSDGVSVQVPSTI